MQLKKIILKGFKSFPEKTVLEFNQGITAIVGPNGSGKSNIIEAIRWVMGEQSAKTLRGERMNDVIFSGTNQLKPLNIAEVELILDNSDRYLDLDYEEISIIRRLSRTEGSTYMINQQECLLRDIVDLFMDSGLGKESFSIISQGKVESIFNSKPQERRSIFEEAAGVYKYKVQKENAEMKLESTQSNLDRVQDILYELEDQIEPLSQQAEKAKIYLEKKDKLTELDVGVTVWQIRNLSEKLKFDKNQLLKINKEISLIEKELNYCTQKTDRKEKEKKEIEKLKEELNAQELKIVQEQERAEASLQLFDERKRHRNIYIDERKKSLTILKNRNQASKEKIEDIDKELKYLENEISELRNKILQKEKEEAFLIENKDKKIDELRDLYIEYLQKQTTLKNEKTYLEKENERTSYKNRIQSEKIVELKTKNSKEKEKLEKNIDDYERTHKDLDELLQKYNDNSKVLEEKNKEFYSIQNKIQHITNQYQAAQTKRKSLLEMKENYTGYYAGVRAIMKPNTKINGIVGTVAESITVPVEYMIAIDTALGSTSQFIIVENEKAGRNAIHYLKQHKKGRATFLPKTVIQARTISASLKNKLTTMDGYIGMANELIKNDTNIQNIVDNLLGQTILAENLEKANKIARNINFKNRVVSLEGDVINAGGSMTGGGFKKNSNPIFSQKIELTTIKEDLKSLESKLYKLKEKEKQLMVEKNEIEKRQEDIQKNGEKIREKEQKLKNDIQLLKEQNKRSEREVKAEYYDLNEIKNYKQEISNNIEKNMINLNEVEKMISKYKEQIDSLTNEQQNLSNSKQNFKKNISLLNEQVNQFRERMVIIQADRDNNKKIIEENKIEIEKLKSEIKSFEKEKELYTEEDLQRIIIKSLDKKNKLVLNRKEHIKKINDLTNELDQIKKEQNDLISNNNNLSKQSSKLEIKISKNEVRIDHNLDYLIEEYKMGYEEAKLLKMPDMSLLDAEKRVKELKESIRKLGPINLNAIEEYKKMNSRFEFLSTQQADLLYAKDNLFNTMNEMDKIVAKRFKETFEKIKTQFQIVFPKMFGGGHAELILENPDDLLTTGVEIVAQPPGKKLSQLSLLSGGERALTAISLLFAIIHVDPIPFCILDEAEAALDDANVTRFGKYLQNFEENIQFIVITHRRGTMEHSNQLYGVTMQDKGVSKIVSVSLSEANTMGSTDSK